MVSVLGITVPLTVRTHNGHLRLASSVAAAAPTYNDNDSDDPDDCGDRAVFLSIGAGFSIPIALAIIPTDTHVVVICDGRRVLDLGSNF